MPGITNFLSDLQMADQYNTWAICLKHISLNIRNIVHSIYGGFQGERSFNWVTLKFKLFGSFLLYFRICSRSFALCYKLCSKPNTKVLSWKYFKYCWTYLKMLITKPKFSKMGMHRSSHRFACMYFMPWNYSIFLIRMLHFFPLTSYLFCVNLGCFFFPYGRHQ